jgi:hypothetical protein
MCDIEQKTKPERVIQDQDESKHMAQEHVTTAVSKPRSGRTSQHGRPARSNYFWRKLGLMTRAWWNMRVKISHKYPRKTRVTKRGWANRRARKRWVGLDNGLLGQLPHQYNLRTESWVRYPSICNRFIHRHKNLWSSEWKSLHWVGARRILILSLANRMRWAEVSYGSWRARGGDELWIGKEASSQTLTTACAAWKYWILHQDLPTT